MVENTLNKIINKKEQKLNGLKKIISIESLKEKIKKNNTFINFKEKIENNIINNKIKDKIIKISKIIFFDCITSTSESIN